MKKLILIVVLFISTIAVAQESLFKNISTTNQYTEYSSVEDKDGDGVYIIENRYALVKFYTEYLPTGEGYKIKIIVDSDNEHKGKSRYLLDATSKDVVCNGYPYESVLTITEKATSFVAIDDYVFVLYGLKDDGISFQDVTSVFIKNGAVAPKVEGKKKKTSFKQKMLALQAMKNGAIGYGPEHKALQKQNLNKMITDYLVAMKAKQNARTAAELKRDENVKAAKGSAVANAAQREKDEWAEAKRYNDSVKATPEWQDLDRRKKQNEANYQAHKKQNVVTLQNNSSSEIYVGRSGSDNPGTRISAGGTASWACDDDAFIQNVTLSGGSRSYKSSNRKVYSANAGCGRTVNIN